MSEKRDGRLESSVKLVTPLLAICAFVWGIYTYFDASQRTAETRRVEATRPYLDRQLALYTEATQVTATIATTSDPAEAEKARKRFDELYWGELALVERDRVEGAMVAFKKALEAEKPQQDLQPLALRLAHACRDELAASWGTEAWKR